MKKIIFIFITLILTSFLFISCDKDKPGELKVLVKSGTRYFGNVLVKIYNSETAKANDSAYATAKTTINQPEVYGALFIELPPQKYFISTEFIDSNNTYTGEGEATVTAGKQITYTLECTKTATGSFEVFVRENALNGPYVPDAKVEIFLSENDRNNGYAYQTAFTPSVDFDKVGAKFENLPYQKYYFKASFTKGSDLWLGVTDAFIVIGNKKVLNILCTK